MLSILVWKHSLRQHGEQQHFKWGYHHKNTVKKNFWAWFYLLYKKIPSGSSCFKYHWRYFMTFLLWIHEYFNCQYSFTFLWSIHFGCRLQINTLVLVNAITLPLKIHIIMTMKAFTQNNMNVIYFLVLLVAVGSHSSFNTLVRGRYIHWCAVVRTAECFTFHPWLKLNLWAGMSSEQQYFPTESNGFWTNFSNCAVGFLEVFTIFIVTSLEKLFQIISVSSTDETKAVLGICIHH